MSDFEADADIYDSLGRRKYLTEKERTRFREYAETLPAAERNFCMMFYYTGCRISEALELTVLRIDPVEKTIRIRTLKRRKRVFRSIPLPATYVRALLKMTSGKSGGTRIWPFPRKTGYRIIKRTMLGLQIRGVHACPKGLRHAFGIVGVLKSIPLPTIAKWMGHSSIKTTQIYTNVVGKEERALAGKLW